MCKRKNIDLKEASCPAFNHKCKKFSRKGHYQDGGSSRVQVDGVHDREEHLISRAVLEMLGYNPRHFPRVGEFLEADDKALTGKSFAVFRGKGISEEKAANDDNEAVDKRTESTKTIFRGPGSQRGLGEESSWWAPPPHPLDPAPYVGLGTVHLDNWLVTIRPGQL
jgi:hypothetical protein